MVSRVCRSYVCLCLNEPTTALECAQSLLGLHTGDGGGGGIGAPNPQQGGGCFTLPSGHRILANMYSADALIQLDRMGEAIRHLDPLKVPPARF